MTGGPVLRPGRAAQAGPAAQAGRSVAAVLGGVVVVLLLLFAAYVWITLHWNYSAGERTGWVQKLSRKGWICKTWEGELSMIAMPGAAPEKFVFTVPEDRIADRINRLAGHRVALDYEQKVGVPTSCFGDTEYFVTGVRAVDEMPLQQPPLQPPNPASPGAGGAGAPGALPGAPAAGSATVGPDARTPEPRPGEPGQGNR